MQSKILTTPLSNIANNAVVDNNLITSKVYNSDMDIFTFKDKTSAKLRRGNLMGVSLFEDLIVDENNIEHVILNMLTKNSFDEKEDIEGRYNRRNRKW